MSKSGRLGVGLAKAKVYVPDRGDVVWLNLDPQAGREQGGRRTCLVLSPAEYNGRTSLAVFCPITNQTKGYPFEVKLPPEIKTTGVVLADHIKSLDWRARKADFHEKVPDAVVREVVELAATLLPSPGEDSVVKEENQ
ncbi:MAG: endoribonuclease MazF [Gemmataceae bacterium]|nr:endoribonuclease MazF [Gemmataceae bacterium]